MYSGLCGKGANVIVDQVSGFNYTVFNGVTKIVLNCKLLTILDASLSFLSQFSNGL